MCVCISYTCLTLNNRFQTKIGCWGSRSYVEVCPVYGLRTESLGTQGPARPELCLAVWTSGEVTDVGRGLKTRGGSARPEPRRPSCASVSCGPPHGAGGRRLARCHVAAVTAVGVRSPPSARTPRLTSLPSASRCRHGSALGTCVFYWRLCSGAWYGDPLCHRRPVRCAGRGVRPA
jgi:hypothetical protein